MRPLAIAREPMNIRAAQCVALFMACLPAMAFCKQPDAELPIAVEAIGVEKSGQSFYLDMRVWNCSNKELTMDITNLPWGGILANRQIIYNPGSGEVMQPQYPIEDFPETPYVIPAGGYISNKVDLGNYFPDLIKVRHPGNWVVFWLYEPFGSKHVPVEKFGGMIPLDQIPSFSPGKNTCHNYASNNDASR